MSEQQTIAIMAAIIHAGCVVKNESYSIDDSLKAAIALHDKAISLPMLWRRLMANDPPTTPPAP